MSAACGRTIGRTVELTLPDHPHGLVVGVPPSLFLLSFIRYFLPLRNRNGPYAYVRLALFFSRK